MYNKEAVAKYRKAHPERVKASQLASAKRAYEKDPEKFRERARQANAKLRLNPKFRKACVDYVTASRKQAKIDVFDYYGRVCVCCGETIPKFLTIDHINNDGAEHRREIFGVNKGGAGLNFYLWLKRHGFPEGFQTLCMNCNFGRRMNNGICPHKETT